MSRDSCCGYCQRLPPLARNRAGKPSRCPMCKQEIWIGSTQTYRLVEGQARSLFNRRAIACVGALFVALIAVGVNFVPGSKTSSLVEMSAARQDRVTTVTMIEVLPIVAQGFSKPAAEASRVGVKQSGENASSKLGPDARAWKREAPGDLVAELTRAKPRAIMPPRWLLATAKSASASQTKAPAGSEEQLRLIPEVDVFPGYLKKSAGEIATFAKEVRGKCAEELDGFVLHLKKQRADLAGLPFLLGKDCRLEYTRAKELEEVARDIRERLSVVEKVSSKPATDRNHLAERFWSHTPYFSTNGHGGDNVPALAQILLAENARFRELFAGHLFHTHDERATRILAQRAVFDLDQNVRTVAIHGLQARQREQFMPILREGLRYPWSPAVRHATEAIAALRVTEIVPELIAMLDQTSPEAPFAAEKDKSDKLSVRELVRVNHNRNCLLCHAPAQQDMPRRVRTPDPRGRNEMLLARVPFPDRELPPPTGVAYYDFFRKGDIVVRADVTYLRQDFSLMQKVESSGKWPEEQRFDFLVRIRELTDKEAAEARRRPRPDRSEYHEIITWALRELTGLDVPANAAAWRAALAKQ